MTRKVPGDYETAFPGFNSPTSLFAKTVFGSIKTTPQALSGLDHVYPNTSLQVLPSRLPLLNRNGLTDWTYQSFKDGLSTPAPGLQYGVFAPIISNDGIAQLRAMDLNFSLGFSSAVGPQELRCLADAQFDLNNDGVAEASCVETLKTVSGYTPRKIGGGDAVSRHSTVARPDAFGTTADAVSRLLHGLDVGKVKVTDGAQVKYFDMKFNDIENETKDDYDFNFYFQGDGGVDAGGGYGDDAGGGYGDDAGYYY